MSENQHQNQPEQRAFAQQEIVQYKDGALGLDFKIPGDIIAWKGHKYTRSLDMRGSGDIAIITMENGSQFALGCGIAAQLPEFDADTGSYGKGGDVAKTHVFAAAFDQIAPNGLPDLTLGQEWSILDNQGPVQKVTLGYKVTTPGSDYPQIDTVNPFNGASELLNDVADRMGL